MIQDRWDLKTVRIEKEEEKIGKQGRMMTDPGFNAIIPDKSRGIEGNRKRNDRPLLICLYLLKSLPPRRSLTLQDEPA